MRKKHLQRCLWPGTLGGSRLCGVPPPAPHAGPRSCSPSPLEDSCAPSPAAFRAWKLCCHGGCGMGADLGFPDTDFPGTAEGTRSSPVSQVLGWPRGCPGDSLPSLLEEECSQWGAPSHTSAARALQTLCRVTTRTALCKDTTNTTVQGGEMCPASDCNVTLYPGAACTQDQCAETKRGSHSAHFTRPQTRQGRGSYLHFSKGPQGGRPKEKGAWARLSHAG